VPYAPFAEAFRSLQLSELPGIISDIPELGMLVPTSNILRKLAVPNRAEAAGLALRQGLVG
jgi:hypothetical protein